MQKIKNSESGHQVKEMYKHKPTGSVHDCDRQEPIDEDVFWKTVKMKRIRSSSEESVSIMNNIIAINQTNKKRRSSC